MFLRRVAGVYPHGVDRHPVSGGSWDGTSHVIAFIPVRDGVNGLLVAPGDVDDLAEKLRLLLSDADMRRRMGEEGLRLTRTVFSEDSYVEAFVSMLDKLSATQRGQGPTGIVFSIFEH